MTKDEYIYVTSGRCGASGPDGTTGNTFLSLETDDRDTPPFIVEGQHDFKPGEKLKIFQNRRTSLFKAERV